MGIFCLLSFIKSWFFCYFRCFGHFNTWTICSRHRYTSTSAGKKAMESLLIQGLRAEDLGIKPEHYPEGCRPEASKILICFKVCLFVFSIDVSVACNIVLVLGMQHNDLIHVYTAKWFLGSFRKLYQEKTALKLTQWSYLLTGHKHVKILTISLCAKSLQLCLTLCDPMNYILVYHLAG